MRGRVDEIGKRNQRGRKADGGPVQRRDQDFRVRGEGVGDVEVERYELLQRVPPEILLPRFDPGR